MPASTANAGFVSAKSRAARVSVWGEQGPRFASAMAASKSLASFAAANHLPSSPGVCAHEIREDVRRLPVRVFL